MEAVLEAVQNLFWLLCFRCFGWVARTVVVVELGMNWKYPGFAWVRLFRLPASLMICLAGSLHSFLFPVCVTCYRPAHHCWTLPDCASRFPTDQHGLCIAPPIASTTHRVLSRSRILERNLRVDGRRCGSRFGQERIAMTAGLPPRCSVIATILVRAKIVV